MKIELDPGDVPPLLMRAHALLNERIAMQVQPIIESKRALVRQADEDQATINLLRKRVLSLAYQLEEQESASAELANDDDEDRMLLALTLSGITGHARQIALQHSTDADRARKAFDLADFMVKGDTKATDA